MRYEELLSIGMKESKHTTGRIDEMSNRAGRSKMIVESDDETLTVTVKQGIDYTAVKPEETPLVVDLEYEPLLTENNLPDWEKIKSHLLDEGYTIEE